MGGGETEEPQLGLHSMERDDWGFLLFECDALTWVEARLHPLMAGREAQGGVEGIGGKQSCLSHTGEQGTGDALPSPDMKPSCLLGSLLLQGVQFLPEAL